MVCLDIVTLTNIHNFMSNNRLGCSCNINFPWYKRYFEILKICKDNNVKLLDSQEEFIKNTKKDGQKTYLTLKCLMCNTIVTTTDILHFVYNNRLGCKCTNSKSENCLGEILKDNFHGYEFIKIRPDWIKNKEGYNLELDFYCEYLKLAFEYQGIQHEQYHEFYHR